MSADNQVDTEKAEPLVQIIAIVVATLVCAYFLTMEIAGIMKGDESSNPETVHGDKIPEFQAQLLSNHGADFEALGVTSYFFSATPSGMGIKSCIKREFLAPGEGECMNLYRDAHSRKENRIISGTGGELDALPNQPGWVFAITDEVKSTLTTEQYYDTISEILERHLSSIKQSLEQYEKAQASWGKG